MNQKTANQDTITKDILLKGLQNGTVTLQNGVGDISGLACRIGNNAFFFAGTEGDKVSARTWKKQHTLEETAQWLHDVLRTQDTALDNGLEKDEYAEYLAILNK